MSVDNGDILDFFADCEVKEEWDGDEQGPSVSYVAIFNHLTLETLIEAMGLQRGFDETAWDVLQREIAKP